MDTCCNPLVSLVIPVYNEEPNIPSLLERLRDVATGLEPDHGELEVLFVDDHSTDNSPTLLRAASECCPQFRYLRLSQNRGSHVAILAGLERAQGDCAVFLASDLQDPPELIPKMLEAWQAGAQVVWAVRESREGISPWERALSHTFWWLFNRFAQVSFPPQGADFALLDRRVLDAVLASTRSSPSLGGAIAWTGFRQVQIPYTKAARHAGRSKWTLTRRLTGCADAFVAFSFAPIRLMSGLGLLMALLGFGYAVVLAAGRLFNQAPVEGWASLMVVVMILGGAQMTMLGILGEYLWRTLEAARGRPLCFVEEESEFAERGDLRVSRIPR